MGRFGLPQQQNGSPGNSSLDRNLGFIQEGLIIPIIQLGGEPGMFLGILIPGKSNGIGIQIRQCRISADARTPVSRPVLVADPLQLFQR